MTEKKLLGFRQKNSGEEKPSNCLYFKEEEEEEEKRRGGGWRGRPTVQPPRLGFLFFWCRL
jgi:hypothetical protein